MDIVEGIKLVGAIVGLGTGGFVLVDRLWQGRPHVSWLRLDDTIGVSIRNVSNEAIFIENVVVEPPGWALAWSNDLHDTVESAARAIRFVGEEEPPLSFFLSEGEERVFHVVSSASFDEHRGMAVRVSWRYCRTRWLPQVSVKLNADSKLYSKMKLARPGKRT